MAKLTIAQLKEEIGYEARPLVGTCSNCESFSSDFITDDKGYGAWQKANPDKVGVISARYRKHTPKGLMLTM